MSASMSVSIKQKLKPAYQPKGSQCIACKHRDSNCSGLPFETMPVYRRQPDGTIVVICAEFQKRGGV